MNQNQIEKAIKYLALNEQRSHNPLTHKRITSTPTANGGLRLEVAKNRRDYIGQFWVTLTAITEDKKYGTQVSVKYNGTVNEMSHKFFTKLISIERAEELTEEWHQFRARVGLE